MIPLFFSLVSRIHCVLILELLKNKKNKKYWSFWKNRPNRMILLRITGFLFFSIFDTQLFWDCQDTHLIFPYDTCLNLSSFFYVKIPLRHKKANIVKSGSLGLVLYTLHGILQARILEWVAFPFSRGSSQPRDQTQVSHTAGGFFTSWATGEAQVYWNG